jgi:UDP-N-acetylmuramate--alanine ligase
MSALAQYLRWQGLKVSGSDRLLSSEDTQNVHNKLSEMDCALFDQDGSGITHDTDIICISTAIEESNPDIAAARKLSIPILHRSDILAAIVSSKKTIAIAGTSGKSTVTAMVFELLTACGKAPSLISGANLRRLEKCGLIGNAFHGKSEYLVIEADESDGTLVKYHPFISVLLNVSKDHKTIPEIIELFRELSAHSSTTIINADDPYLKQISSENTFGLLEQATWYPDTYKLETISGVLNHNGIEFRLPLPGYHNLSNLCASLATCEFLGCDKVQLSEAVAAYQGVARRFTILTSNEHIHVVDDFAHNPEKIKAAVSAARNLSSRIIAVYQPHGFGPTRFLKEEYLNTFRMIFTPKDSLYLLPIYYAGGTAQKDISSQILISELGDVAFQTFAPQSREDLISLLDSDVSKGDCVLLMGARDPSLSPFAQKIADRFGRAEK